eukprot:SM000096S24846  [mRNA]  locus=s96:15153:16510:+ [translate_table: standard]
MKSSCSSDTGSSASLLCDVECDLDYASLVGHIGRQVDAAGIAKGTWLPEEDRILIAYVERHGPKDWNALLTKERSSSLAKQDEVSSGYLHRGFAIQGRSIAGHAFLSETARAADCAGSTNSNQACSEGTMAKAPSDSPRQRSGGCASALGSRWLELSTIWLAIAYLATAVADVVLHLPKSSSASKSASADGTSVSRCAVDPGTTATAHVEECSRRECLQSGVERPAVHPQHAPILCSQCCAPQASPPCDAILASPSTTAPGHWEVPACSSGSGVTTTDNDMLVHNDWDYEELLHSLGLQYEDTKVPPTPGANFPCAEGRQDLLWQELECLAESNFDVLPVTGDWQSKFC